MTDNALETKSAVVDVQNMENILSKIENYVAIVHCVTYFICGEMLLTDRWVSRMPHGCDVIHASGIRKVILTYVRMNAIFNLTYVNFD